MSISQPSKRELLYRAQETLCFYCGAPIASIEQSAETLLLPNYQTKEFVNDLDNLMQDDKP